MRWTRWAALGKPAELPGGPLESWSRNSAGRRLIAAFAFPVLLAAHLRCEKRVQRMAVFQSKPFRRSTTSTSSLGERIASSYRRQLQHHPFLSFGLPFLTVMVAASFLLTPATALRYERHDRKHRALTHSEAMELGLKGGAEGEGAIMYNPRRRKVTKGGTSERDEYYRLMAKDLDDWEQKRVKRWKGEPDGRL